MLAFEQKADVLKWDLCRNSGVARNLYIKRIQETPSKLPQPKRRTNNRSINHETNLNTVLHPRTGTHDRLFKDSFEIDANEYLNADSAPTPANNDESIIFVKGDLCKGNQGKRTLTNAGTTWPVSIKSASRLIAAPSKASFYPFRAFFQPPEVGDPRFGRFAY